MHRDSKRYSSATVNPPPFSLALYRNDDTTPIRTVILNGVADTPGGTGNDVQQADGSGETAQSIGTDEDGNTIYQRYYTWEILPEYDEHGEPYIYTVSEPNVPLHYVRISETGDAATGFVITNEYNDGTFRARKDWDTKMGTVQVTFRLERATTAAPDNWKTQGKTLTSTV